jgi:glyoxylase-like metal-dependent hydrolase (beta-lactamase superfamily II)
MGDTPYEAIKLDETCWRIEENGVRAFLVVGSERALLVDTGFGTGNIREMVESLTDLPVQLVNTHADRDHIGCNRLFETAYMHPSEFDRYHQGIGYDAPVEPLWEGARIDVGGRRFEVILIPGHTPGSIALLDAENKVLIGGDSVQAGTIFLFGPGRNLPAYRESMRKLDAMKERFETVYPSHGPIPFRCDIADFVAGAEKLLRKEVVGTDQTRLPASVKVYDTGTAKFLYEEK